MTAGFGPIDRSEQEPVQNRTAARLGFGPVIPQGTRYPYSSAIGPFTIGESPIDIIPADFCLQGTDIRYDWMSASDMVPADLGVQGTTIRYDWMATTYFTDGCSAGCPTVPNPVVQAPNGPYAAGTTPVFTGQIVDRYGFGVPAADLVTLTLTIADTLSNTVINGVNRLDILNTGRGTVDDKGNVTITLEVGDTTLDEGSTTQISRSLIIEWTGSGLVGTGRHEVDFWLEALAGPQS